MPIRLAIIGVLTTLLLPLPARAESPALVVTLLSGTNERGAVHQALIKLTSHKLRAHHVSVNFINLKNVPLDFPYGEPTPAFAEVERTLRGSDGIIAVIPEYQGSYPGILKVFLDQLEYPASPLAGKVATFVGHSGGDTGGQLAVETLSRDFQTLGANIFAASVTYIAHDAKKLEPDGLFFGDPEISLRLESQISSFLEFLDALKRGRASESTGKLFAPGECQKKLESAGTDEGQMNNTVTSPLTEHEMVDAGLAYFRDHYAGLTPELQACLWEELSNDIDQKLGYPKTHVARGYRWNHEGALYYVYQGPLAFEGGKHSTLVIPPSGAPLVGLTSPVFSIEHWDGNLTELKKEP